LSDFDYLGGVIEKICEGIRYVDSPNPCSIAPPLHHAITLSPCGSITSSLHHFIVLSFSRSLALSLHHSQSTRAPRLSLVVRELTNAEKASTSSTRSPRRRLYIAQRTCRRRMSERTRRCCGVGACLAAQRKMEDLGGCTSCVLQGGPDCVVAGINAGSCRQDCFGRRVKRPQRQVNRPQGRKGRDVPPREQYVWTDLLCEMLQNPEHMVTTCGSLRHGVHPYRNIIWVYFVWWIRSLPGTWV
jgi:hypothetical protein